MGILWIATVAVTATGPPLTKKRPVTDVYHGVRVSDDYRWLEDGRCDAVQQWSDAQNAHARSVLDRLPHVARIRARVTEILAAETVSYNHVTPAGGKVFAIKRQPPRQQPFLIVMDTVNDAESARILVDPNRIDPKGGTSIDWCVPSLDGKLVAVSLSRSGTESGDVHVFETAGGRPVHEVVPRVNGGTAGGDLAWAPDSSGFFYTRYPRDKERAPQDMAFFQQVYFHRLGTPAEKDRYEMGKGLPRIAEIQLEMDVRTGRLLATVQDGDGGEFAHFLRSPQGRWQQFSKFGDRIVQAAFGGGGDLYLVSRRHAPRGKILRLDGSHLDPAQAKTIVPQGKDTIVTSFWDAPTTLFAGSRLYVIYQLGGPSQIRVFDERGNRLAGPEHLAVSAVGGLAQLGRYDMLFWNGSYTEPGAWHRFRPQTGKTEKTSLSDGSPVHLRDVRVVLELATSKDGTKVPLTVMLPAGARRDGPNPCVVTGYGGYSISITPRFRALNRVLFDQGVIYVVANLRGGGEFGEAWHRAGNLTNKQNVFDDFAAVLEHLVDRGYTTPSKVAIVGGSNGGLPMGATMTQHPELMRAVVSSVGIYDMLRVERSPNGAFNIPEFGTVKNREQFLALHAYSPYHHVKDNVKYPATLFLTGANDPRVDPMQSRKMTARLQAATASSTPILLRTSADSGHGGDTSLDERIEQKADVLAFLFHQLGVRFR